MKLGEVQKIAKAKKIKFDNKAPKADLIRTIQKTEGNYQCFGTAVDNCDQTGCLWRADCLAKNY